MSSVLQHGDRKLLLRVPDKVGVDAVIASAVADERRPAMFADLESQPPGRTSALVTAGFCISAGGGAGPTFGSTRLLAHRNRSRGVVHSPELPTAPGCVPNGTNRQLPASRW